MQHLSGLADQAAQAEVKETTAPEVGGDSQETTATDQAPELNAKESETKTPAEELADLQKLSKFKFEGKEMTYDELKKAYMRHSDYTKKTQALAEERKFQDNLRYDLESLKKNPSLLIEFKRIYPEKFHAWADFVLGQGEEPKQETAQNSVQLPKEILEKLSEHERALQSFQEEKLQAETAKIDAHFETLEKKFTTKYPYADLPSVYHQLDLFVKQQREENPEFGLKDLTDKVVEGFYKATHEHFENRFKAWNEAQVKKVREANKLGGDIPRGGAAPVEGAKRVRLKDVPDMIMGSPE